ncbi:MAG: hypothetical protein VX438_14660, partial [Planctomycetota bacterium]|nr:hypothetical protein [Planctomycetota bacterium]
IHLMNDVGTVFAEYVFRLRKEEHQSSTALVGAPYYEVDQPELTPFADIFNLALISGTQPEIDSVPERLTRLHLQGITTCSCPLFDFRDQRRSESDTVDEIESRMISSANQQLASGLGGCKLLMPISSMGFQDAGGWNDQEQIHLVYELLSSIKGQYPRTPLVIGLDQPFGEPRVFKQRKSALQLAENLIRMQAPVAAFCLEINIGYYPEGTWIRDLFSFNDLLDSWGQFDYPLIVQFRIPGGVRTREAEDGSRLVTAGLDSQASWLEKLALLALAKHNVAGVLYAQVFDQPADPFFGAGLISSQMNEKPAMATIKNIVQQLG